MHDKLSLKGKEKNNDLKLSFLVKKTKLTIMHRGHKSMCTAM